MPGTPTERTLKRLENGSRLERLAEDLLYREGYHVDPTGTRGTDGGRDSILTRDDDTGILHCSISQSWEQKVKNDAESAADRPESFEFFIFGTTQNPAATKRDRVEEELREEYGWKATILDFERLRNRLVGNPRNHDLAKEHLDTDPGRAHVDISESVLQDLREQYEAIQDAEEREANRLVESLVADIFEKTIPDVNVRKSQFFGSTGVYEFILTNNSSRYPWRGMGEFVFADCKWRHQSVGVDSLRSMIRKAESIHPECSGCVIFSKEGVTDRGEQLIRWEFAQGTYVLVFDEADLREILEEGYTDEVLEQIADSMWL
ncbi:hypothetical protein ACFQDG_08730 [Natronoarchaeum mannanilyticum]|uniref:Restriction endonuclease n=1 Tax=Natronoarchaeum mannanilyticum TaxID=926360 RepID=A0AAV3T7X4_9EURY